MGQKERGKHSNKLHHMVYVWKGYTMTEQEAIETIKKIGASKTSEESLLGILRCHIKMQKNVEGSLEYVLDFYSKLLLEVTKVYEQK